MIKQIRILLFTNNQETSARVTMLLDEIKIHAEVIATKNTSEFAQYLTNKRPDLVIIDYPEISYEGLSALSVLKAGNQNLQIIFINENIAENEKKDRISSANFEELEIAIKQVAKVLPMPDEVGLSQDSIGDLLNSIGEIAFFVRNDLIFAANDQFGELFGSTLPILLGNRCDNIFSFDNTQKNFSKRNLANQSGEIYSPYLPENEKFKFTSQQLNERCSIILILREEKEELLSVETKENVFSYDVRTLMNSIIGYSILLNEQLREANDQNYFSMAEKILQNSKALLSKLEGKNDAEQIIPEPEEIDLRVAIERIVKDYAEHISEPNPNITQAIKPNVTAILDESLFRRGFVNLLAAIHQKFPDAAFGFETGIETSSPVILLKMYFDKGRFSIEDLEKLNGGGNNNSAVFSHEIFWLKEVMQKSNSSFYVASMPGGGLMLDIGLPRPVKTTNPVKDAVYFTGSPDLIYLFEKQPNILIVEDHADSLKMLEVTLHKVSHLDTATSGKDALKLIEDKISDGKKIDLFLFDIGLPEPIDGIQLMYEVKKRWHEYSSAPFIAQTAFALRDDKNLILRAGFDSFISKPIDRKLLIKVIATSLRQREVVQ